MIRLIAIVLALATTTASLSHALERTDLSKEAQQLVPDKKMVRLKLKSGKSVRGIVTSEDDVKITLQVRKPGSRLGLKRPYKKADVAKVETMDVTPFLAEKLLEIELDEKNSPEKAACEKNLRLLNEFLTKCKGADKSEEITKLHDAFALELKNLNRGMEKVDGNWLTPVCASIEEFHSCARQMTTLKKRKDFNENRRVKECYDGVVDKRRATARELPKMVHALVPKLIDEKNFDDAVTETTAFLQFWIDQVIQSEGSADEVIQKMDFASILSVQTNIMDAYRKEGMGKRKPRGVAKEDDMVYIPGGYFLMGKHGSDPKLDTFPMHVVFVSPFLIDRYEVSNSDYRKFVDYVRKTKDDDMEHPDATPGKKHDAEGWKTSSLSRDEQPVVGVDWFDAYAYAKWVGKRLCTEAEWEKAARGMYSRLYPWGDDSPDKLSVNWTKGRKFIAAEMDRQNPPQPPEPESGGCSCIQEADLPPPPPTRLPGCTWDADQSLPKKALQAMEKDSFEWKKKYLSPYKIYHMAGNAAEWVNDWYDAEYYSKSPIRDPQGPETGHAHIHRGGSYLSSKEQHLTTYLRGQGKPKKGSRKSRSSRAKKAPFIGFRCAKSLDIAQPDK